MTTEATVPDDAVVPEDAVIGYFDSLSNWGRWGSDDEAGTLNLITPERRIRALALARDGVSVSCSRMLAPRPSRWVGFEYTHRMNSSGEAAPEVGSGTASDWFGLSFHGYEHTHLDSHSHVFWNGQMYNGRSAALCTTARGALAGGVEPALGGILRPRPAHRRPADPRPGMARTGRGAAPGRAGRVARISVAHRRARRRALGTDRARRGPRAGHGYDQGDEGSPGLSAACLPWLREKDISMLISDVANDVRPSPYQQLPHPIHIIGIVAMGLWLVDNALLEPLLQECQRTGRYEFLSVVVPLALRR